MERLSFLDQVMHKIGTSGMPALHMQGAMVIDPSRSPYEINAMIIAEHIAARLCGFDILRKKLVQDPLKIGDLRLIEDPDFDVWDHITFATLPSPGDQHCLEKHLGAFSSRELEMNRSLWSFEIIEGLEDGKIAIAQKLSHATMDGTAAMKVMMSIFDQAPSAPSKLDLSKIPNADEEPTNMALLSSALKENAQRVGVDTPKILLSLSKTLAASAKKSLNNWLETDEDDETSEEEPAKKAPITYPTSVNQAISSNKRVVAVGIFETDKLKTLSKALGCKLNDVCLLMASEALSSYFAGIGEDFNFDYVFIMPMNTRAAGDNSHGNALALSSISGHNTIKSLPKRLQAIHNDTAAAKSNQAEKKASMMSDVGNITDMVSPLLIDFAAKLLHKIKPWDKINFPANGILSNVAGPRDAMYFAGMPIEYQIPMIPVFHKAALAIGATSMGNHFSFGFHACGNVVKEENLHFLTDGLQTAYNALTKEAAKKGSASTASPSSKASKTKTPKAKIPKAKVPKAKAKAPKAKVKAKSKAKKPVSAKKITSVKSEGT